MGKIVKYCNACEEGFAEKFGFCPNCGAQLTAFEMNPVVAEPKVEPVSEPVKIEEPAKTAASVETAEQIVINPITRKNSFEPVTEELKATAVADENVVTAFEFDDEVFKEKTEELNIPATAAFSKADNSGEQLYNATFANQPVQSTAANKYEDGFHVTIVEEKNVKQRNLLLLGFFVLLFSAFGVGVVYSMFNKLLSVGAIDTPDLLSYVGEVEPTAFEEEIIKRNKEKGGGGGGGGKDEDTPASKGREAAQTQNPLFAPSSRMDKLTNPTIPIQAATTNKNDRKAENTDEPYGLKNGGDKLSDGMGSGGGLGNGKGRGQGNGEGDGLGNGKGNGRGNGEGDGEGNGKGGGGNNDGLDNLKVTKPPVGPTVSVKIISKPRPSYTDAARVNNVQGTVVLKVTFLASGQVGGVSVVKGLPNGLTEQAIAAAKSIKFEPAKRGGVPYSVTKPIEYNFAIF